MLLTTHASYFTVKCTPACENGGICSGSSFKSYCDCPSGYWGSYCQFRGICSFANVRPKQKLMNIMWHLLYLFLMFTVSCIPSCQNGGTCEATSSSPRCKCRTEYTGSYCQKRIGIMATWDYSCTRKLGMQSKHHGNVVHHGVELLLLDSMFFLLTITESF